MKEIAVPCLFISAIAAFGIGFPIVSHAETACDQVGQPQALLECALRNHPAIRQADSLISEGASLEGQAAQRPNPELNAKGVWGQSLGDKVFESEVSLLHTFELGGKRGSRIEKARAEAMVSGADAQRIKEEVAIGTVKALYRLRQLRHEIEVLDEALETFSTVSKQLKSRPRLSPEQEVSLAVFQLAFNDYSLRRSKLYADEKTITKQLGLATGFKGAVPDSALPAQKKQWPVVAAPKSASELAGAEIQKARAEHKSAEAQLSGAKSESWPNLAIGPTIQTQSEGALSYQTYGLSFSLPLPLYNANGAGREVARRSLSKAEATLAAAEAQFKVEYESEIDRYGAAVEALKRAESVEALERKHKNMEALFQRGLVASSLIIEAHRQIFDWVTDFHEQELQAIAALWRIYALEGKVLKEKI